MSAGSTSSVPYTPIPHSAAAPSPGVVVAVAGLLPLFLSVAFVLSSAPSRGWASSFLPNPYLSDTVSLPPPAGTGCDSPTLLLARNNASFWQVEVLSTTEPAFAIQPSDAATYYNCPELALASFTVRLHYPNETHLVNSPPRQGPLGRYVFVDLPTPIRQPGRTALAEIEARLEFGHFPGMAAGQPCDAPLCTDAVYPPLHSGIWSGEEIVDEGRRRSAISMRTRRLPQQSSICGSLDYLPAISLPPTTSYIYTTPDGEPCTLPTLPDPVRTQQPRWIHLMGDSNMRPLVQILQEQLGLGACTYATWKGERYTTHAVCDDAGNGYILTYAFVWFKGPRYGNATDYDSVDLASLSRFIATMPFDADSPRPPSSVMLDIPLTHLFITTGSHLPQLSANGMRQTLDDYRAAFERKIGQAEATSFASVASVNPAQIPAQFGNQAAMRNNVMIARRNAAQKEWIQSAFDRRKVDFLDLFSMSMVVPDSGRRDAIHFHPFVYDEWARIFVATMELARRRREEGQ